MVKRGPVLSCVALAWVLLVSADTVHYTHDNTGRLMVGNSKTIAYTYDSAGNLLSRQVTSPANSQATTKGKHPARRDAGGGERYAH